MRQTQRLTARARFVRLVKSPTPSTRTPVVPARWVWLAEPCNEASVPDAAMGIIPTPRDLKLAFHVPLGVPLFKAQRQGTNVSATSVGTACRDIAFLAQSTATPTERPNVGRIVLRRISRCLIRSLVSTSCLLKRARTSNPSPCDSASPIRRVPV